MRKASNIMGCLEDKWLYGQGLLVLCPTLHLEDPTLSIVHECLLSTCAVINQHSR